MSLPQSNPSSPALKSALPGGMLFFGAFLTVVGACASFSRNHGQEFALAWLLAFMFYYSIALGALFMVMVHHLTDAGWSVGIRRFSEHLAGLLGWPLVVLFAPVVVLAPKLYEWMNYTAANNNLVAARQPVFSFVGFVVTSAIFFAILWFLSARLRALSLKQDETGAAACTRKMAFHSGWGIVAFSLVLTFSACLWMKSLEYQWFSAMYGVYFFASSTWAALALIYVISVAMLRRNILTLVLKPNYFYFIGVMLLGFTLLAAYTEFAQYFVVWNANVPEETFWYLKREMGGWWWFSMLLIVGKFFVPFFVLLPIHTKTNFKVLVPTCLFIFLMHYGDLAFNILPSWHPGQHHTKWLILHLGCVLLMGGFLAKIFVKNFNAHAPYPQRDPRLLEAMGVSPNVVSDLVDAQSGGAK